LGCKQHGNPIERGTLNPTSQKWLATVLTGLITGALGRLLADAISRETPPPAQRSLGEDTKEAAIYATVSVPGTILASVIVRRLSGS
jgi:hypothetical protein